MNTRQQLSLPTNLNSLFAKSIIGFDEMFNKLDSMSVSNSGYPPYNIIKKSDNTYVIQLALAGFSKHQLTVEHDSNIISITGTDIDGDAQQYIHKGISTRSFVKQVQLMEHMHVTSSKFVDGLLTITVEQRIPEELRKKIIEIE